jgi:putative DNA primase/helicase
MDHADEVRKAEPRLPEALDDRPSDNWTPLLAIADVIGGTWPEAGRRAALALSGAAEDDDLGVMLLADLRELVDERGPDCDRYASADVVEWLKRREERPWSEWHHGKPISANSLSKLLGRFGVSPRSIRVGDKTPRGYLREDLEAAWAPYMSAKPQHTQQRAPITAKTHFSGAQHDEPVADVNNGFHPHEQRSVAVVAVPEPDSGMDGLPPALGIALRRSFEPIEGPIGFPTAEQDATARERLGLPRKPREPMPGRPNLFRGDDA